MSDALRRAVGLVAWAGAAFAALSLNLVPGDFAHALCGPWGWLPPLQALAALHLFWAVLIVPPAALAVRRLGPANLRRLGVGLTALGLAGLAVAVGRDLVAWLPGASDEVRGYVLQRVLFAVGTVTDVPLCQVTLTGLVLSLTSRRRRATEELL